MVLVLVLGLGLGLVLVLEIGVERGGGECSPDGFWSSDGSEIGDVTAAPSIFSVKQKRGDFWLASLYGTDGKRGWGREEFSFCGCKGRWSHISILFKCPLRERNSVFETERPNVGRSHFCFFNFLSTHRHKSLLMDCF